MKIAANISLMFKELLVSMASMVGHIQFADARVSAQNITRQGAPKRDWDGWINGES